MDLKEISPQRKQEIIKEYSEYADIFIETGSYYGDTVSAVLKRFKKIISIELGEDLFKKVRNRFLGIEHITIIHGDSGKVLKDVLADIHEPVVFWLDAHYSGGVTVRGDKETPIMEELECIFDHSIKDHVILIDDARMYVAGNCEVTRQEIKDYVFKRAPNKDFKIKNDIIYIS